MVGKLNDNARLDTSVCTVEFPSGELEECTADIVAESICAQVDDEGHTILTTDEIVDHKSDQSAVQIKDAFIMVNGQRHRRQSTKGWKLCVRWKDGTTTWMNLKDLKDAEPMRVA